MSLIDQTQLFRRVGLALEVASTEAALQAAQSLRHQVYSLERKKLPDHPERLSTQDRFDAIAKHVVIRRVATGEPVATTRVVPYAPGAGDFPMLQHCDQSVLDGLPKRSVGEISRFAISKVARGDDFAASSLLRLGLLHGVLVVSREMRLTHWCAVMEPSLMRLLALTGVRFQPIGPLVELYGWRQPCVARIDTVLADGQVSHPHLHRIVAASERSRANGREPRPQPRPSRNAISARGSYARARSA